MKAYSFNLYCIFCFITCFSFIFPISILAENEEKLSCEESRIQGERTATEEYKSYPFFEKGFVAGAFLPVLGTGIMIAKAADTIPQTSYYIDKETVDEICYKDGYREAAKKKNIQSAIVGGLIGTTFCVVTVLVVYKLVESAAASSIDMPYFF